MDVDACDGATGPDEYACHRGIAEIAGCRSTVCRHAKGFGKHCVAARRHRPRFDRASACIRLRHCACRRCCLVGWCDRHGIRFAGSTGCVDCCSRSVGICDRRNRHCVDLAFAARRFDIEHLIRHAGIPDRRDRRYLGFAFAAGRFGSEHCTRRVGIPDRRNRHCVDLAFAASHSGIDRCGHDLRFVPRASTPASPASPVAPAVPPSTASPTASASGSSTPAIATTTPVNVVSGSVAAPSAAPAPTHPATPSASSTGTTSGTFAPQAQSHRSRPQACPCRRPLPPRRQHPPAQSHRLPPPRRLRATDRQLARRSGRLADVLRRNHCGAGSVDRFRACSRRSHDVRPRPPRPRRRQAGPCRTSPRHR